MSVTTYSITNQIQASMCVLCRRHLICCMMSRDQGIFLRVSLANFAVVAGERGDCSVFSTQLALVT